MLTILTRIGNVICWLAYAFAALFIGLSVALVSVGKAHGLWFTIPVILIVVLSGRAIRYMLRTPME